MDISQAIPHGSDQSQQFLKQYSANALLPTIDWSALFQQSCLTETHIQALNTLYLSAVPLALQVFDQLEFDVFQPAAYQPQGLGLFEKLQQQEQSLLQVLEAESKALPEAVRHQMWSMLLRGGAVLVFKAWLGKVKTNQDQLDTTHFDELSDLLFIKTSPQVLADRLEVNTLDPQAHIFLMHDNEIYLDRFNSLETAALFVALGVYDAAFLSLRDDRIADYLMQQGYVSKAQIEDLQCALNPMFCTDLTRKQSCLA